MNKVALVYDNDFKKLDFGLGHPMQGDWYEETSKEFKRLAFWAEESKKRRVFGSSG